MKLFKTTDEKLRELGFVKTDQGGHGASYEREMRNYTQVVALVRKKYGDAILQSYDRGLFDAGYTGNMYASDPQCWASEEMGLLAPLS